MHVHPKDLNPHLVHLGGYFIHNSHQYLRKVMKLFNFNNNEQGRFRVDVLDDVLYGNIKIHSHLIF